MKKIEAFEKAIENKIPNLREAGINPTLFWAYRTLEETGNERIDFNECIWEHEIEDIANCLKENGIYEFTISSTFSSLIDTLAKFEKHGFRMNGLCIVNLPYNSIVDGKRATANAIKMKRA